MFKETVKKAKQRKWNLDQYHHKHNIYKSQDFLAHTHVGTNIFSLD
jgi:hypothetical protein